MYSTCLFCNGPLGHNEAIEHFPVGRRLAFDLEKGRLWVVCRKCERWNLSPLETRWEAMEEAERAYRGTAIRVSTDNIGLARLSEGLELVRLGAPPRPELAAWRYGDQFGRRRRKKEVLIAAAVVGTVAPAILPVAGFVGFGMAAALTLAVKGGAMYKVWADSRQVQVRVRDDQGGLLPLTHQDARCAVLVPTGEGEDWTLKLPYWHPNPQTLRRDAVLTGDAARRALATMLPHLNSTGGSVQHVREATEVAGSAVSLDALLHQAAMNTESRNAHIRVRTNESNVAILPPRIRLALEMALHEEDERRAMEGELLALETRWREAEEIAAIADSLFLPPGVEDHLATLRQRPPDRG